MMRYMVSHQDCTWQIKLQTGFEAWAHSCGCKSRRKVITASEVKRNCMRATDCGKEARSVNCEPMDKNRIEGAANKGAAGVDGLDIDQTARHLATQWPVIRQQLLAGTYRPSAVGRVTIPKPDDDGSADPAGTAASAAANCGPHLQ